MAAVQKKDLVTPLTKQVEYYSDFYDNLASHPIKKDLLRATNESAVKIALKNLLLTNRGEHFFDGESIGSDLRRQLFEHVGPASEGIAADLIRNTITNHEPRCKILDIRVDMGDDLNAMTATIVFSLINKQQPITLEVTLDRVR